MKSFGATRTVTGTSTKGLSVTDRLRLFFKCMIKLREWFLQRETWLLNNKILFASFRERSCSKILRDVNRHTLLLTPHCQNQLNIKLWLKWYKFSLGVLLGKLPLFPPATTYLSWDFRARLVFEWDLCFWLQNWCYNLTKVSFNGTTFWK